jgi:hypothetical protein
MSVIESHIGGRRAAARDAAETRKKILLAGLAVVLLAVLAFELPKIMKRSSSPSSTASTSVVTTANPAVPVVGGSTQLTAAEAKRLRVIRQLDAKDPFVPLIHESTTTSSSSSSSASTPAATQPSLHFTPSATTSAGPAATKPVVTKPGHVKPTAAVIWTNGHRQVIGLGQTFKIGDVPFRLVAVTPKAVRLEIVGGAFMGGKQAIRVRKGHPLKLANNATGVQYRLLFARGTTEAPTATQPATQPAAPAQPSSTQPSDSTSSTESTNANAATGS